MEQLGLIVLTIVICVGAAYKWIKYVEACTDAYCAILKGQKLIKAISRKQRPHG